MGIYVTAISATDDCVIRRLHFAYLITKVIDPHSEHVILFAFERQQWLGERAASLRLYVHCQSCYTAFSYSPSLRAEYHHLNNTPVNFYRCTVHSDIHAVHSPTDAHLLKL